MARPRIYDNAKPMYIYLRLTNIELGRKKAEQLGVSLSRYINDLMDKDLASNPTVTTMLPEGWVYRDGIYTHRQCGMDQLSLSAVREHRCLFKD